MQGDATQTGPAEMSLVGDPAEVTDRLAAMIRTRALSCGARLNVRTLRTGPFRGQTLTILGPPGRAGSLRSFLPTVDQVAGRLTLLAAAGVTMPSQVERILLIPEGIVAGRYLLSHLFTPDLGLLSYYMYPRRLNRATQIELPGRWSGKTALRPGLLQSVLEELRAPTERDLLQFVVDTAGITATELSDLERTAYRFS